MLYQSLAVVAASLATANAHMIMAQPVPYSADKLDNAPITAEQYPCKSNLGFTVTTMNTMAAGSQQKISWKGSATHGGGACQLSVTLDVPPTKDSVFKVIKSFEGPDCPQANGATLDYTMPDSIPTGKSTFAWSWFSSESGAPELYMNCAPLDITGGASDKTKFNALPDMLVANIASTTCKSPPNGYLKFPDPGQDVVASGVSSKLLPPTGSCGPSGPSGNTTTPAQPSGQPSAPSAPSAQPSAGNNGQYTPPASVPASQPSVPADQPSVPAAKPTAPAGEPKPTGKPAATSTAAGGVFAPGASGAAGTSTTLVTVTAPSQPQATEPSPAAPTTPAAPAPAMPSGTGTTSPSSPSSGNGSGTCTTNGAVVCNGEKQFGLCNNGNVIWQDVAAGTTCVNGVISKRSFNGRIARPRL